MRRLIVYAAIAAAMLSVGGARAYFTAQAEVKDSVITAGTVRLSVEPTSAPLAIDPLAPGETVTRVVEVTNTGKLSFEAVTTAARKAGFTSLWNALTCRAVSDGVVLYDGALAAMRTAPLRVEPGGRARIEYHIGLPTTAGNDLQGDYVRASLYVDAEQSR